jgi:hypothetical protein
LIFVIGGVIVLFAVTLALLALSFLNSTYGFQAANRAAALADGGVHDVMLQLQRDKDFESAGYCLPYSATLPCPSGQVQIVVTQGTPIVGNVTATADVTVLRYRRRVQAVFSVNASSGLVQLINSQQVSL